MSTPLPFTYDSYREFLSQRIKSMPSGGHGQLVKVSKVLRVHPTLLTQVLKGKKSLNAEHGLLIAEYFGLGEFETEYFLLQIEHERAGHFKLRARIEEKMKKIRVQLEKPQARIPRHHVLTENDRATFYSEWFYSAIRLFTDIKDIQNSDQIADALGLDRKRAQEALSFLLKTKLIVQENGKLRMGPQRTYLPPESPLVARHHANWRLKAIENFHKLTTDELAFTAPISVSEKDFAEIRKILLAAIEQISNLVAESKAEKIGCVSMDLFYPSR